MHSQTEKPDLVYMLDVFEGLLIDLEPSFLHSHLFRDISTIRERTMKEGIGFLNVTLPKFGDAVLRGLEDGYYSAPHGFKKNRGCALPAFLQGLLSNIFQKEDGVLLANADHISLYAILQISYLWKKVRVPCGPIRDSEVVSNFLAINEEMGAFTCPTSLPIVRSVLSGPWPELHRFRHGPGAVAQRLSNHQKALFPVYNIQVMQHFGDDLFFPRNSSTKLHALLNCVATGVSKMHLVPKDGRGPRLIAAEPVEHMFVQQALRESLEQGALRRFGHRISFKDQSKNGRLALASSLSRSHATIDMKNASDRIPLSLVAAIFPQGMATDLIASRSKFIDVNGSKIRTNIYATAGNATCFPIESIIFCALMEAIGISDYSVFGDDIIVPTNRVQDAYSVLKSYGFVPNESKSFYKGHFRESCGVWAFKGHDVTPIMLKELPSLAPTSLAALVSQVNQLRDKFFHRSANVVESFINQKVPGLPTNVASAPFVYVWPRSSRCHSFRGRSRWDPNYTRLVYRYPSLTYKRAKNTLRDLHQEQYLARALSEGALFGEIDSWYQDKVPKLKYRYS